MPRNTGKTTISNNVNHQTREQLVTQEPYSEDVIECGNVYGYGNITLKGFVSNGVVYLQQEAPGRDHRAVLQIGSLNGIERLEMLLAMAKEQMA